MVFNLFYFQNCRYFNGIIFKRILMPIRNVMNFCLGRYIVIPLFEKFSSDLNGHRKKLANLINQN